LTSKLSPDFSIWSFCYAKGSVPCDFTEGSPVGSNQGLLEIPMIYSAIAPRAESKLILVDTGFAGGRSMTGRAFVDFENPRVVLAKIEREPKDVGTIVMTHLHFDHAGNIDVFPHATIVVQRYEYESWKRVLKDIGDEPRDKTNWILSSLNLDDISRFDRAIADGRVAFVEGEHDLCPGVRLNLAADSHTFGSQWVEVTTADGPHVIAGDAVASFANLERMWPPGYHQGNCWSLLNCYGRIKATVGENRLDRIVPGHDMEVFRRLPSWIKGQNPVAEVHLATGQGSMRPTV
jgi:N-acyl homoserine lactone hydrolase